MNINRRYIIGIILLVGIFGIFALATWAKNSAPKPPEPTPTPTELPGAITVTGLGAPALKNAEMQKVLGEPWTDPKTGEYFPAIKVDTRYADKSTDAMLAWGADPKQNKPADYSGIDFVQVGDIFYVTTFKENNPTVKILEQKPLFQTRLMLYTWWRWLPAFKEAGFAETVTENVGGKTYEHFVMPREKVCQLFRAQYEQYISKKGTWQDLGFVFDDPRYTNQQIDLDSSSAESSTAAQLFGTMANCFANDMLAPAELNQVDGIMPYLEAYIRQQGGQTKSSIGSFGNFWSDGEGSIAFIAYDSAYLTTALSPEYRLDLDMAICRSSDPNNSIGTCKSANRIVGIYLGEATSAQHTMMALTENGRTLLRRMASDPRIQQIAFQQLGMSTPAVVLYDAPITWMSTSEQVGDNPRDEVYIEILKRLKTIFK